MEPLIEKENLWHFSTEPFGIITRMIIHCTITHLVNTEQPPPVLSPRRPVRVAILLVKSWQTPSMAEDVIANHRFKTNWKSHKFANWKILNICHFKGPQNRIKQLSRLKKGNHGKVWKTNKVTKMIKEHYSRGDNEKLYFIPSGSHFSRFPGTQTHTFPS